MKSIEQQLQEHQAKRPEMPRPFVATSPEAIAWHKAFAKWADEKDPLQGRMAARNIAREERIPRQGMRSGPWGGAE